MLCPGHSGTRKLFFLRLQICDLIFGAWSYHTSKMNLTSPASTINLDSYKRNGEWEISGTVATRNEFFYECCPDERFSNVAFQV